MEIIITDATDVFTARVSKHGTIHGLERHANRDVKVVLVKSELKPLSESPLDDVLENVSEINIQQPIVEHSKRVVKPVDKSTVSAVGVDTLANIRGFVAQ